VFSTKKAFFLLSASLFVTDRNSWSIRRLHLAIKQRGKKAKLQVDMLSSLADVKNVWPE
jgi:hypothetical protein